MNSRCNTNIETLENPFVNELLVLRKKGRVTPMAKGAAEGIKEIIEDELPLKEQ